MQQTRLHAIVVSCVVIAVHAHMSLEPDTAQTRTAGAWFTDVTLEQNFPHIDAGVCTVRVRVTPMNTEHTVVRQKVAIPIGETRHVTIGDHPPIPLRCERHGKVRFL